jgi:hypothetical protein
MQYPLEKGDSLMPDLDIVTRAMCLTHEQWERTVHGSKGDVYTVSFGRVDEQLRGVMYDYMCTCPDFGIRRLPQPGAYCKHIRQVQGARCGWDQLLHGGEAWLMSEPGGGPVEWACPECNGPVTFYRAGV